MKLAMENIENMEKLAEQVRQVELKATKSIAPEHLAQTMNYLKTTGYPLGLVINFGSYQFETRKVYPPTQNSPCSPRSPECAEEACFEGNIAAGDPKGAQACALIPTTIPNS